MLKALTVAAVVSTCTISTRKKRSGTKYSVHIYDGAADNQTDSDNGGHWVMCDLGSAGGVTRIHTVGQGRGCECGQS